MTNTKLQQLYPNLSSIEYNFNFNIVNDNDDDKSMSLPPPPPSEFKDEILNKTQSSIVTTTTTNSSAPFPSPPSVNFLKQNEEQLKEQ